MTITGTGFVPDQTTVTIGGITVPTGQVTVIDAATLTFVTPAHAPGPVDVTVTTPGGTTTPALVFTFVAPVQPTDSAPTVVSINPSQGPTAGGTTVTITGTSFVPGQTTVSIGGVNVPAGQVTVSTDGTTLTFVTPTHAEGAVVVTVSTPNGTAPALPFTYVAATGAGVVPADGNGDLGTDDGNVGAGDANAGLTDSGGSDLGFEATPGSSTSGELAATGADLLPMGLVGLAAAATGTMLLWTRRRVIRR